MTPDWIHVNDFPSGPSTLDVTCETPAAGDDLGTVGTAFENMASTQCFYSNTRRVLGYGAPIIVFIVRGFQGNFDGCSLGPLTDYITAAYTNPITMAHEMGHACDLWHVDDDPVNLMNSTISGKGKKLRWWQIPILRGSRHASYF